MNGKDYIVAEARLKEVAVAYANCQATREQLGEAARAFAAVVEAKK